MKSHARNICQFFNALSFLIISLVSCGGAYLISAANAASCRDEAPCAEWEDCQKSGYKCMTITLKAVGSLNDKSPNGTSGTDQCGQFFGVAYGKKCNLALLGCGGFVPVPTADCPVGKPKE